MDLLLFSSFIFIDEVFELKNKMRLSDLIDVRIK